MALQRLNDSIDLKLLETPKMTAKALLAHIKDFTENEQKEYAKNNDTGALTFGKFRGMTVDELVQNETGKSYCSWLVSQSWLTPDKFPKLLDNLEAHGITKASASRKKKSF